MSAPVEPAVHREVALVDLLDRLLAGGVVVAGDLTLSIADVDLVRIDLKALISSVNENVPAPWRPGGPVPQRREPAPVPPAPRPPEEE